MVKTGSFFKRGSYFLSTSNKPIIVGKKKRFRHLATQFVTSKNIYALSIKFLEERVENSISFYPWILHFVSVNPQSSEEELKEIAAFLDMPYRLED